MDNMPTRWSYSSLSTYESCPAQWRYSYLLKLESKPSPAMMRGSRLHKACEDYLNGHSPALPWELKRVVRAIDELKQRGAKSEQTWLLDKDWSPVDDQSKAWIKSIVDVHYLDGSVLHVIDFKSGKEYPEHRDQLELYAIKGLKVYPEVKRAEYKAMYLDTGHTSNEGSLIRDMLPGKIDYWHSRAIRIWEDKEFAPNPGRRCQWCDYSAAKRGPCQAGS